MVYSAAWGTGYFPLTSNEQHLQKQKIEPQNAVQPQNPRLHSMNVIARIYFKAEHRCLFLPSRDLRTYFLCCAEERLVQMTATTTTTTTVMTPTVTTMMTRRLLFFWGVTLPWGGCICPMGGSERR